MAVPPNAAATIQVNAASASSRVGAGSRTSADRIEGTSGAGFFNIGVGTQFQPDYSPDQDNSDRSPFYRSNNDFTATPLVFRSAAAFSASEANETTGGAPVLFLTDLQHAIGIYEFNMKVTSGMLRNQGNVVNAYS